MNAVKRFDGKTILFHIYIPNNTRFINIYKSTSDNQCPFDDTAGIRIKDRDRDLAAWSGKWSEYVGSGDWEKNSKIKVKCGGE